MAKTGIIAGINGPVVRLKGDAGFTMNEMVYVGSQNLVGEVIGLTSQGTVVQVYEETTGIKPGEVVTGTGAPVSVTLAPGILTNIFDGIERPLSEIAKTGGAYISRGVSVDSLDTSRKWKTHITVKPGDYVYGGTIIAEVPETPAIVHKVMVPPDKEGRVLSVVEDGEYTISDPLITIQGPDSEEETLTMTQRALDSKAVERSIDALCKARRIVIIGNGNSGAIAMDAQHKFLRIGLDAQAYTDDHMQMIAVVSLTPEDVVLAISHSGSSRDVGDAARLARERGATVITITNNGISPVSKLADIRLYTYSQETKYRTYAISSRMAELTIIDTLYTGVSLRLGEQAIGNFEALEKALVVKKY